jgi:hypothetical protein
MRLAVLATVVTLLICAANHRVRVGAEARRAAAELMPPAHPDTAQAGRPAILSVQTFEAPHAAWADDVLSDVGDGAR